MLVALSACLLSIPSLWIGWQTDDYLHRAALEKVPEYPLLHRGPIDLFSFVPGDPQQNLDAINKGLLPWWSHDSLRLAFLRPVTGITHWLDYKLWPRFPLLMHLHSLAWFAGVVAVVCVLYRRLISPLWVAGLASLMFALDDAHGLPAVWIANRNSVVAMLFGMLTLWAHDRWRRDGRRLGAVAAPVLMLVALLSAEAAVATGAYLLSYALFLENGRWRTRLVSLLPCGVVGFGWWLCYKLAGYGAIGSGLYVDPAANPARFGATVLDRLPLLLWGQWSFPPSDLHLVLIESAALLMWAIALVFVVGMLILLIPAIRHQRELRFFLFGTLVGALPSCSAFPSDRLLMFVGFGGMGVVALFVSCVVRSPEWLPRLRLWRLPATACCVFLLLVHLVAAPLSFNRMAQGIQQMGAVLDRSAASLPAQPEVRSQHLFIVNAPTAFLASFAPVMQALRGIPIPASTMILASGIQSLHIQRTDEYTLLIRPTHGFLGMRGELSADDDKDAPFVDARYVAPMFDHLFRDIRATFSQGQIIELANVRIQITELTENGRPAEAEFRFAKRLDDPSHRWAQWKGGVYEPFRLPDMHETVTLPSVDLSL